MNRWMYKRLVDKMIDAYVDWRETCGQVHHASCCWQRSTGHVAGASYAAYSAALDREQRAAEVYEVLVRRVASAAANAHMSIGDVRRATPEARAR